MLSRAAKVALSQRAGRRLGIASRTSASGDGEPACAWRQRHTPGQKRMFQRNNPQQRTADAGR
jgi:hypothetical protein